MSIAENLDTPYHRTLAKLTILAAELREAARQNSYSSVLAKVDGLREYKGCEFCKAYRLSLDQNYAGVCVACPCHKIGERTAGRPRAYNGCYVRAPYREMVRMAWWFRQNPDAASAERLAQACEEVMRDMQQHEQELK
jgi:hypothetical protein